MRTVWLSMRESDAEPSGRGMADLMAAARSQVAARKPAESAWKRAFATFAEMLRRPPVLALATVVLVAGTAVLVHNHGGMAQDEAPVASRPPLSSPMMMGQGAAAPAGQEQAQATETAESARDTTARSADTLVAPGASPTPVASPMPTRPPPVTATAHVMAPSPKPASTLSAGMAGNGVGGAASGGKAAKPAHNAIATDSDGSLEEPSPAKPSAPPPPVKIVAKAPMAPDSGADDSPAAAEHVKAKPGVANDQLLRECEAAAARGDCAAVRILIERIRAQDLAFYRSTVTRDGALTKCLPQRRSSSPRRRPNKHATGAVAGRYVPPCRNHRSCSPRSR